MARINVEYLQQQLIEAGKQLSYPSDSIHDLLFVLDQVEKLLSVVDQCPLLSMLKALKPSMKALVQDSLLKHVDVDVKVAVASCLSEIMRITAPDAPYDDDQMREVFQLIVSSFEHLADHSSRSYNKRALILENVSKVRLYVIMLDIECDGLIVKMFEYFLRSVRDYHLDSIYSMMESIMVLVLEESELISVELLKPLLASVKKDSEGVLPVARKLGEGVILKSADKLKPYLMPAIISLGDTLDNYTEVVASVCEETTATIEQNDENASGLQPANKFNLDKESADKAHQADESKPTAVSSDHTDQVVKDGACPEEVEPTLDRSPKSVTSNGVNVTGNGEASDDHAPSKKPEEDADDSDALNESKPEEQTSKKSGKAADAVVESTEPMVGLAHKRAGRETSDQSAKKSRFSEVEGGSSLVPPPISCSTDAIVEERESDRAASRYFSLDDKDTMGPPSHQNFLPDASTPGMDDRVRQMGLSGVVDRLEGMANESSVLFSHAAKSIRALERTLFDSESKVRTLNCRAARDVVTMDVQQKTCEEHSKRWDKLSACHAAEKKVSESRVTELESLVEAKELENSELKKRLDELVCHDKGYDEKISVLEREVADLKSLDVQMKLSWEVRAMDAEKRLAEAKRNMEAENSELKKQLDELVLCDQGYEEKISMLEREVADLKSLDEKVKLAWGARAVDAEGRATEAETRLAEAKRKMEVENSELKKPLDELFLRDQGYDEKISVLERKVADLKSMDEQLKISWETRAVDAERRATEAEKRLAEAKRKMVEAEGTVKAALASFAI